MLQHAQHILGVEIVFMLEHADMLLQSMEMHSIPQIQQRKNTSSKATSKFPAMLFPRGAELYALYTDMHDTIFVRTQGHEGVFFLQEHWQQLTLVLPKDSICRAIVYRNKDGNLVLGVYDVLRLSGVDQKSPIFESQKMLCSLFHNVSTGPSIVQHWVGEEGCLLEHMQTKAFFYTLPFEIDNMLRIDEHQDKYSVVLRPLLMG